MRTIVNQLIPVPLTRSSIMRIIMLILAITLVFNFELGAQEKHNRGARRDSIKAAKIEAGEGILSLLGGPSFIANTLCL